MRVARYDSLENGYQFFHYESPIRLHSNLYRDRGYPADLRNLLSTDRMPDSYGAYTECNLENFYFAIKRLSKVHEIVTALNRQGSGDASIIALQRNLMLRPGEQADIRFVRSVHDAGRSEKELVADARAAKGVDLQRCVDANERLFARIPRPAFRTRGRKWCISARSISCASVCFPRPDRPPVTSMSSPQPRLGVGHGHQVMHESLSMIPYAYLDPVSAEESQRIYIDQQYEDGLIAYRHGPRGPQVYPHEEAPRHRLRSSAGPTGRSTRSARTGSS